ncbi:uncharacterized protein ATNIH1004_009339 [Aspergillus tanneri]|uniref:Uncharacterized protein n=1 Tax=Aspergillus tanneri TaxID=1220188 RepID=A0A5M9MDS3_9EURO|nr:uncharacterized protein ATNIH1004_009339 [Aspergillus tanneri]KAA8645122.1 hypothetical protein ATNIH1004_009339 [Aspergillus tanneri]
MSDQSTESAETNARIAFDPIQPNLINDTPRFIPHDTHHDPAFHGSQFLVKDYSSPNSYPHSLLISHHICSQNDLHLRSLLLASRPPWALLGLIILALLRWKLHRRFCETTPKEGTAEENSKGENAICTDARGDEEIADDFDDTDYPMG